MSLTLVDIDPTNYKEVCFSPLLPCCNRRKIDFQFSKENSHLQIYHSNSIKDWEVADLKFKNRAVKPEDLLYYSNRKALIKDKQDWIEQHVDRRIQLFFQQAVLCYNAPFFFKQNRTEDQIGSGSMVKFSPTFACHTEAAHSSTLPCLIAYLKDENGAIDTSKRFVYLKYSHYYHQHSSTMELPPEVNETEMDIDGDKKVFKLRLEAIKIINQVAGEKLDPKKATKKFLKAFLKEVDSQLREGKKDKLHRTILKIYRNHIQKVQERFEETNKIFDRILGVNLSGATPTLCEMVYKKRYALLQEAECIESQIAKRIFRAKKDIFGTKIKSLKWIDYRLRYILLSGAQGEERKFLERFFCTSIPQLQSGLDTREKLCSQEFIMNAFERKYHASIECLRRDLSVFQSDLTKLEQTFRADLFKSLREEYKQWTRSEFAKEYKKLYPDDPMSWKIVSLLEQPARIPRKVACATAITRRRKDLDIIKAEKIATTFGIDVGLFLPGLIASL